MNARQHLHVASYRIASVTMNIMRLSNRSDVGRGRMRWYYIRCLECDAMYTNLGTNVMIIAIMAC